MTSTPSACLLTYEEHFFGALYADLGKLEKKITGHREGTSEKPKPTIDCLYD